MLPDPCQPGWDIVVVDGEAGHEAGEGGEDAQQRQCHVPGGEGVAADQHQAPQAEQVRANQTLNRS